MAAELQNGVELRNSVDNSSAEAGLKQLESAAADTARKISDNAAKESARQARAEEAASRASNARLKRRATMALAIGTAGLDMAGQGLRMAGQEEVGQALSGAAEGARELGTMLAPLGWQAAAVGAALGAAAGGIKSFVDATEEHRKRMEKIAQGLRDSGAAGAIEESHLSTPEERAEYQAAQRQKMADLQIKLDRGATISSADVLAAARWDKGLAQQLLARNTEQAGGVKKADPALNPLRRLYEDGEDQIREIASPDSNHRYDIKRSYQNLLTAVEGLGPEILATARSGSGYDPVLDLVRAAKNAKNGIGDLTPLRKAIAAVAGAGGIEEIDRRAESERASGIPEERGTYQTLSAQLRALGQETIDSLRSGGDAAAAALRGAFDQDASAAKGAENEDSLRMGRLSGARADALSAQGIGYTGNPMQETEKLLREIRDDARRRKPSDSGLLTA